MGTGGRVSANSVEYMETACKINEDKVIHPFAFRTHTHALGTCHCHIQLTSVLIPLLKFLDIN